MSWSLTNTLSFLRSFCVDESITRANLIQFIELRYAQVYNKALKFYQMEKTFATVASTKYAYLARDINTSLPLKFFNQTTSDYPIEVVDYAYILNRDNDEDETGTPTKIAFVELSPVQRQPNESSDTGTVGVKSSSASDTSQEVTISGLRTSGTTLILDTEEISLNGTTFVAATKTGWHTFNVVSKSDNTAGFVTVSETDGGDVYAILDPYADTAEYQKWRLWPTPTGADTIKIVGHRKPMVPQSDSAIIDVPQDFRPFFIHGLRADIHDVNFDMIKAQKYEALFQQGLQDTIENDTWFDDEEMSLAGKTRRYSPLSDVEDVPEDSE